MLIGYMRVSKADGSQVLDLQRDALIADGVRPSHLYEDQASGKKDDRPGLEACLKSLREGDTLIVWKLDRLGRSLRHLVNTIHDLMERKVGFRVLTGQGANIDTTTASGRLVFGIFAALAEFERELIRERTIAGLASARARGRNGGRPYTMTPAKLRLAQAAMAKRDTKVGELCKELGVTRQTLYRFVDPKGGLRKFDPSTANEERQRLVYSYGRRGRPRGGPPPLPSCPGDLADLLDPPPGSQNRRLKFVGRKGRPDKLAQQWNQHAICIEVENALIVEQKISRAVKAVAKETGLSCSTLWKYRKESRGSQKDG